MLFDGTDTPAVSVEIDLGGVGVFTLGVSELGGPDILGVPTPNWTALPAIDVRSISTRRGRAKENQAIPPGSVDLTLDNRSAFYDPDNANGPYVWNKYSVLSRGLPLRVRAALVPRIRTNLIGNPSMKTGIAGWVGKVGCTISRSTAESLSDGASMQITATATPVEMRSDAGRRLAVLPGTSYTASAYLKPGIGTAGMNIGIGWVDSDGIQIDLTEGTVTALPTGAWTRVSVTTTAPKRAVAAVIWLKSATNASADTWYADHFLLEAAGSAGAYFDGETGGYQWSGLPDASASYDFGYVLFQGFVEKLVPDQSLDPVTTITATDALAWLGAKTIPAVDPAIYSGDTTSVRAGRILDAVSWSPTARSLSGARTMRDTTLGDSALALLEEVARSEAGRVFASRDGNVVVTPYEAVFANPLRMTFSDERTTGTIEYDTLKTSPGAEYLLNKVRIVMAEDSSATYQADGSVARYGEYPSDVKAPLLSSVDALSVAQATVERYAYPQTRVDRIEFDAPGIGTVWPALLQTDLGDRASTIRNTVDDRRRNYTCVVESLNHDIKPQGWRVTIDMSPASASTYFVLGASELGGPDKLYY